MFCYRRLYLAFCIPKGRKYATTMMKQLSSRNASTEAWTTLFQKLKTKMLTSTAWHPQTDGQSERTNQTVEIALRYFLTAHPDDDFTVVLPYLQATLNNSNNASTGQAPNEIIYGFRTNDALQLLNDLPPEGFSALRNMKREETEDSIAWANAMIKTCYNAKHKPLNLKAGDEVFLTLHRGYTLRGLNNKKLTQQRADPFKVLAKVRKLASKLDLPPLIKIHPMVSFAQLEPVPSEPDPYQRLRNIPLLLVNENDKLEDDEYYVERIIDKKMVRDKPQYLIKWRGEGPQCYA